MRRRAEVILQAAAMQAGRRVVGGNERDLIAFADLADGDGDGALIGADDGADLLLRDQALGLGAALLRIGLVIGEHEADLRTAEARQTFALGQRQVESGVLVDDFERGLIGLLRVDALLSAAAGERIDHADHDLRGLCARCQRHESGSGGGSQQHVAASDRHGKVLCYGISVDRMKGLMDAVKPEEAADAAYQITAKLLFFRSVTSIRPGECVIANGSFAALITDCGVTPQAQNTGISSSATGTGSP